MGAWTAGEPSKPKAKARRRRTGRSSSPPRSKWSKEINNHVKKKNKQTNKQRRGSPILYTSSRGFPLWVCMCVFQECDTLSPAEGAVELHISLLLHCVVVSHLLGGTSRPVAGWTLVTVSILFVAANWTVIEIVSPGANRLVVSSLFFLFLFLYVHNCEFDVICADK